MLLSLEICTFVGRYRNLLSPFLIDCLVLCIEQNCAQFTDSSKLPKSYLLCVYKLLYILLQFLGFYRYYFVLCLFLLNLVALGNNSKENMQMKVKDMFNLGRRTISDYKKTANIF